MMAAAQQTEPETASTARVDIAGKLRVFSSAGDESSSGMSVDLDSGSWRNYSTGISGASTSTASGRVIYIQPGNRPGVCEIASITVSSVADRSVILNLAGSIQLQSLLCAGDIMPLYGGESARFFCFGLQPQLSLPEITMTLPVTIDIWMRWTEDLGAVAVALVEKNTQPAVPTAVSELRGELFSLQAERVALAAECRRLRSNEYSAKSAASRAESSLLSEQNRRQQLELELASLTGEIEQMRFTWGQLLAENRERHSFVGEIERLKHELLQVHEQIPELHRVINGLSRERDDLRDSYSWKITAPLRAAFGLLRTR